MIYFLCAMQGTVGNKHGERQREVAPQLSPLRVHMSDLFGPMKLLLQN